MPKRKRSSSAGRPKKSVKRFRKYTKRARRIPSMVARVKRVESIIRKTLEKKHTDWFPTASTGDVITNTAPVDKAAFFRIADVGAGEERRIGNKVTLLSQRFTMNLVKGGPGARS